MTRISIPDDAIDRFCRDHHIRRLSFFGSVLRDDFEKESDVDVLVEFEPGREPGYFELVRMQDEFQKWTGGHPVDLVTRNALHERIRNRVLEEAEPAYER